MWVWILRVCFARDVCKCHEVSILCEKNFSPLWGIFVVFCVFWDVVMSKKKKKGWKKERKVWIPQEGFEPPTSGTTVQRSIQLSYRGWTLILSRIVYKYVFFVCIIYIIYMSYLHLFINQWRYASTSTLGQCRYVSVVFLSRLCCPQLSNHTISEKMLSAFGHP